MNAHITLLSKTVQAADSPVSFRRHAVLSPHVVVHGSPFDRRAKTFICIDGKAMLSAKSVPDAVCLLYATYYALWLEFPKAAVCCYKYLESEIFEQKAGKLPPKLIRLLASCSSNLVWLVHWRLYLGHLTAFICIALRCCVCVCVYGMTVRCSMRTDLFSCIICQVGCASPTKVL